ncbi:hypothetical protein IV203_019343 [Nitzschia inconspicua]|uniref:DUF6824 domain-containing protein n=1 Tax=Nitzschia inconspicua TaxID=303405 RepID=A0A9K3LZ88_9STRA|nr:hypothetical protein IV203_019343 [Nitzschia inconspicua]
MIMMSSSYSYFNRVLAVPSSPSSDEKIFPNFDRMSSSASTSRQEDDDDDDVKKPSASKLPPGVAMNDVLCGRDKVSHAHVGNKQFRSIIETYREVYQNAHCRDQKTNITCSVIAKIHSCGGRFLKLNEESGVWEEVGEQYAREKVSHALRSAKDPNRPKITKPRKIKKYVPSKEEDAAFREALEQQQQIFQSLLDNHVEAEDGSVNEDTNKDNKGHEDSDGDGEEDWDFYQ